MRKIVSGRGKQASAGPKLLQVLLLRVLNFPLTKSSADYVLDGFEVQTTRFWVNNLHESVNGTALPWVYGPVV